MYVWNQLLQFVLWIHNQCHLDCNTYNNTAGVCIKARTCVSLVTSGLGSGVLLRCKKWRCDKHSSGDVACKHQSFGRCAVSKLAVYSPRPSHTPLSGLRLIVCRLPYEEQLIHTESNCKRTEWRVEKRRRGGLSGGEERRVCGGLWRRREKFVRSFVLFHWDQNVVKNKCSGFKSHS